MKRIIAALSRDHVIGSGDGMPWHIPEEYAQYLDFVRGQTVIMGRRSYEIFGADLTSRHNLVVSRRADSVPGAEVCPNLDSAFEQAESFGTHIYVAGGTSIYEQTLDRVDQMYLSYIKGDFEGDRFFPKFDLSNWEVTERRDHPRFEFVVYTRRSSL